MARPFFAAFLRYGVVYATTGVFGLGVLAWMAYRSRRSELLSHNVRLPASPELIDSFDLGAVEG